MTTNMMYPIFPEKKKCCGCSACEQICKHGSITMQRDEEGFLYPTINKTKCKKCGTCMEVCPSLHQDVNRRPIKSFAAINQNEPIRMQSSSGGIFTLLAESIIDEGGVVFGATFDAEWNVVHRQTNQKECLKYFRGSKYVQSRMGNSFHEVKKLLDAEKSVMFVGTPCQIAGLHHYLRKPYEKLLTIDFICHGVPSPAVWQWYLHNQARTLVKHSWLARLQFWRNSMSFIRNVEFRNKQQGWKQYQFVIGCEHDKKTHLSQIYYENPYMKSFLKDADLRPSCYKCFTKNGKSHSDITLADFWNVHKVVDGFDDDKGTSLILLNSEKGFIYFNKLQCKKQEVNFDEAIQYNQAWSTPYPENPKRKTFFQEYRNHPDDFQILAE